MRRLLAQPWIEDPSSQTVLQALNARRADCARFVGGCVRNALLGEPVNDVDIATQLTPDESAGVLRAAGAAVHPTGIEHGTITAVVMGRPFEVTTLRRDVSTDGRRAVVAFTEDWTEDAQRRDFRINALYCDADGRVHDPTGMGLADVEGRRIVFIGDPEARIREDYLRILRFFRFSAWYGRRALNADGLDACARLRAGLERISAERIWAELKKLLAAPEPTSAMRAMAAAGVLETLLPEAHGLDLLEVLVALDGRRRERPDPLVRFLSLFSKDPDLLSRVADRLRMSNEEKARILAVSRDDTRVGPDQPAARTRAAVFRLGRTTFLDRLSLAWAATGDDADHEAWAGLALLARHWRAPTLPLTGEDVLAAGVPPGPQVGAVLRALEDWWVEGDFRADRTAALGELIRIIERRAAAGG